MAANRFGRYWGDFCLLAALLCVALLAVGCHHEKQQAYQPPPPAVYSSPHAPTYSPNKGAPRSTLPSSPAEDHADITPSTPPPGFYDDITAPPVSVETGLTTPPPTAPPSIRMR
jgi:hypothetical protein